jgi:E3 ubiquitin-protein ligase ZNF598
METNSAAPASPRPTHNPRGGRGRRGSGSNHQHHTVGNQRGHGLRGGRGERRGRGRGRGDLGGSTIMPDTQLGISNSRRPGHAIHGASTDGGLHTEPVLDEVQTGQRSVRDDERAVEEGEVCFICASTIEHLSIAPCNHQTCHICALRLRALYKKRDCAYCKASDVVLHI